MLDTSDWSARKKLKYSLLKRAFEENRGPEVILLIQWRTALTHHKAEPDTAAVKKSHEQSEQPRALRALNLLEEKNGSGMSYKRAEPNSTVKDFFKILADMPMEQRILYRDPLEDIIAKTPALNADHYDPMEGLKVVSGYDMATLDMFALELRAQPLHTAPKLIQ